MIRVFRCDGRKWLWGGSELLPDRGHSGVMWIDLENPSEDEEAQIFDRYFSVHSLSLEDIRRPRLRPDHSPHLPKVEEFPDYLFVIVNPLLPDNATQIINYVDHKPNTQLSAVLTHTLLITHHYEPLQTITKLRDYMQRHNDHADRGPDFIFHLILDEMVDDYIPVLDRIEFTLDDLETEVFAGANGPLLVRLLGLKRTVIGLRKTMIAERELLARLHRGEFTMIDEREKVYYRNVYDHLLRFTELIEASREMVSDLMQTLLASQANKLNSIMKVLTMISVTILPMSLIAGIYGMNFENNIWPDFKQSQSGFATALAMMLLSGLGALGFFRLMRWL
ncbi:MAG: magnesium and cobalt transport protein CorA [Planctomycetia bacterium]|nr:magnesium and cobalt transport protein CorA [Planctomycetia bacterium]